MKRLHGHRDREGRDRRLGRARLDAGADRGRAGHGPARPAAPRTSSPTPCPASPPAGTTLDNAHALMQRARRHGRGDRHPRRRACRCSTTSATRSREGQAGVRRHLRERAGRRAHLAPVPPRQPARRARARHRRPERAGARLGHLRRRRPHVALQRQCLGAEDADPAPDPLGGAHRAVRRGRARRPCSTDPRHRDLAGAGAGDAGERARPASEDR